MRLQWTCAALVLCCLLTRPVLAQDHTGRGAVLGGVTGALAGAGIGEHNGDAAAGALIGGALGLVTGAAIGNSMDQDVARTRAYEQRRTYQMSRAATVADVVNMTHNRISDTVIINHILQNGVQRRLEVGDVISLHRQGVSEPVISAMQRAPLAAYSPPPAVRYQAPVVVERYRYVAPPSCYRPAHVHYRPSHHYHRHASPSLHWSIGVGR